MIPCPSDEPPIQQLLRIPFLARLGALGYNMSYAYFGSIDSPVLISDEPLRRKC